MVVHLSQSMENRSHHVTLIQDNHFLVQLLFEPISLWHKRYSVKLFFIWKKQKKILNYYYWNIFSSPRWKSKKSVIDLLYSGKLYSISMTAGWSPFKSKFKTWLFVKPIVEMPSIWWIRSPDARKSTAGPNVFNELIIGGYDRSVRSVDFINAII